MPVSPRSIAQLSVLLQSGALSPVALAEETLANISNSPDKAIFTTILADRAMQEAEAAALRLREGRSLGMLDGIPVAWKDLFDIEGLSTTAGSVLLKEDAPAEQDAAVVRALAAAGMVSVGRVNMSEFAFSGLGINPHYGTPRNPHSPAGDDRIPGGSSSGSGVAVASGLVPVSIGTDTGGSVRIPAAFNGIVGYKASRGRYAMQGVFPLAKSLDSLGPLCYTVQDAIWVDAAMRGLSAQDALPRADIRDLTLVIPQTVVFDGAEPEVLAAFESAVGRLQQAGARVEREEFPEFSAIFDLMARYGAMVTAEAYVLHRERMEGVAARQIDERVVKRTLLGKNISLADYLAIVDARERLTAAFEQRLGKGRMLISPTLPHVAPAIEPLIATEDLFFATNGKTLRNTLIGNFLDFCAVSLPCGFGADGMPVGIQIAASYKDDSALLAAAQAVENCLR